MPNRFAFVPMVDYSGSRRPKYFFLGRWERGPITSRVGVMDYGTYGLTPLALVFATDISVADDTFLAAQPDVYIVPLDLDTSISDVSGTRSFFESFGVPANWLTPSNTYRELLRQFAGVFQFAQRYYGIAGQNLLDQVDLDDRYRNFPTEVQAWFDATVASFGYDPGIINQNSQLCQMMRQAGAAWGDQPFTMSGQEF